MNIFEEERISFEISADPFYSKTNLERLKKSIDDVNLGNAKLTAHELIEVEDK